MLKTKLSYEELLKEVEKLEKNLEEANQVGLALAELEKRHTFVLKDLDNITRETYAIRSIVNMPQLYLDDKLNIVGYSSDFMLLTDKVIKYAMNRKNIRELLSKSEFEKLKKHLEKIKALEDLPYEKGEQWQLRYQGPKMSEVIGTDWIVYRDYGKKKSEAHHWRIVKKHGKSKIFHDPHVLDNLDCCLLTSEEYGGADEDVKLVYKIKTSKNAENIRDLSVFISATSGREAIIPDMNGYTICVGSNYNSLGRIQKQGADVVSRPEVLDPDTEYQLVVERTGGRISRRLFNLDTDEEMPLLEFIDYRSIYDSQGYIGLYTYCGEAEFYDIEIYTRKSHFDIEQFRIPPNLEIGIGDENLVGKIFGIRYAKNEILGKTRHMLILEDITQRKKDEEALRENEEKYRKLFEEGRVARSITTPDGRFLDVNPEMLNLFGHTKQEILALNAKELYVEPRDRDTYINVLQKQTFVRDYDLKFKKKDGTPMDCQVTSSLHIDKNGNIIGIQGSIHDITERKRIEARLKESQRMEVIGRLASGVAHEVRNPLNAILAISEALVQEIGDNPEYKPYLDHIRTQVDRLSTLMKDLLDLGKPLQKKAFVRNSIKEICTGAIELWRQSSTSGQRNISLPDDSLPGNPEVLGDSAKLKQVIFNLLENAAQHSPEDSEITVGITKSDAKSVSILVRDEGSGVPADIVEEVFKPFFTTRSRGSGLGLSIVQNIIELHGGAIALKNNDPPPGLTVEVVLPVCEAKE